MHSFLSPCNFLFSRPFAIWIAPLFMNHSNFTKLNNLLGWGVFLVAAVTYTLTLEPTVSFWDCGEYIATSAKLQVGHPPGAPLFQLLGAFIAQFALGNVTQIAFWVNMLSALSSAFTILFLFWTTSRLALKVYVLQNRAIDQTALTVVFGSALVGSLAYTFSDSFWFSAVEGEVYAMSSFFTAIAFWAILKWEEAMDFNDDRADRWIIFIAYLIGLSVGVHILVFLTIPAIGMIYYFKKFKYSLNGFIAANIMSVVALALVFSIIIPFILSMFGKIEIFFVNSIGLPFDSGTLFTVLLLAGAVYGGVFYARKVDKPIIATAVLSIAFIVIGYSTFVTLVVRSNANTPIDENNPEDALSMLAYYNREQYGDWPVLYGQSFNADLDPVQPFKDGKPTYYRDEEAGKYLVSNDGKESIRNFDPAFMGFFPRMWSDDPEHVKNYQAIMEIKNTRVRPSFGQHFGFFMNYQIGQMWWRYFMWNFAGKQNDEQNRYEPTKGNWMSGISFFDEARLGPQKNLPQHFKNNKGRNFYYLLPFILGLIGMYFHFKNHWKDAWAVLLFFFFTGIAIVLYTNHKPFEPRERDYAFVGSFYVFAIWIGLGVQGIFYFLKEQFQTRTNALLIGLLCLVGVPGLMAQQNWDDHDRSNRYTAREVAKAYLDSCKPNAILFTNGDNDTFPLWYIQEIEGYRTDVRIVNLSLLNTDWYIDQMKRKAYDSDPVPFGFTWDQYKQGTRDVVYYREIGRGNERWMADDFMKWVKSDDAKTRFRAPGGKDLPFYPVKKIRVPVNRQAVLANKVVEPEDEGRILDYIDWDFKSNYLPKRDLMVMDLITYNDWSRPIYFSITVGGSSSAYFHLDRYFQLEGLAYRFVPMINGNNGRGADFGKVQTNIMAQNLLEKFPKDFMNNPDVYYDETCRRLSYNFRNIYARLANALIDEGQVEKAIEVLDFCQQQVPNDIYGYNYFIYPVIEAYYRSNKPEKAREMINAYADQLDEEIAYYQQFKGVKRKGINQDLQISGQYYTMLMQMVQQYEIKTQNPNVLEQNDFFQRYKQAVGGIGGI